MLAKEYVIVWPFNFQCKETQLKKLYAGSWERLINLNINSNKQFLLYASSL